MYKNVNLVQKKKHLGDAVLNNAELLWKQSILDDYFKGVHYFPLTLMFPNYVSASGLDPAGRSHTQQEVLGLEGLR